MSRQGVACVFCVIALLSVVPRAAAATFSFIGSGEVSDISLDGSIVVGSNEDSGTNGYWRSSVFTALPIPSPFEYGGPSGVSADGQTFVGKAIRFSPNEALAVRWTATAPPQLLDELPGGQTQSAAFKCSADGAIIVGHSFDAAGSQPVRWTSAGIERLTGATGFFGGEALDVSADGSVIVGTIWEQQYGGFRPFRWTQSTGIQILGGGAVTGFGTAVTPDGSMILGTADNEAFRWTESNGFEPLGQLLLPHGGSTALAASADGSIVVGQAYFPRAQSAYDGFIWDAAHGMRSLTDYVENLGFDLQGQVIEQANAISADGTIIAGRAFGPLGGTVFVLEIPEPASTAILIAISPLLLARRRIAWRDRNGESS